ncbi:hypothetical protein CP800_23435, partial [Salmonella enterica]|nr:hypothetical protein [Salmonella enterica]
DDCASQRKKAGKGKGWLRVTAPDRKRPKGLKGYSWRRAICIRRYLAQSYCIQATTDWCSYGIPMNRFLVQTVWQRSPEIIYRE